jgi:Ca2+-transporting ATPase
MWNAVKPPHSTNPSEIARDLDTDPAAGLSESEAAARLTRIGPNVLAPRRRPRYAAIALRQIADPLVALLALAAAASLALDEMVEAATIGAIVLLNAALGFAQEARAEQAVVALRKAFRHRAPVVRERVERDVPVEQIVPGDLIVLREGGRVAADARLVDVQGLAVDESALTGESLPVEKTAQAVPPESPLAERSSMVFTGSAVTRGRGRGIAIATATATQIGEVAALTAQAVPPPTPLQQRLGALARVMFVLGLVITAVLTAADLAQGSSLHEAFLLGVSVAVAAIPEGLAATVTIALAIGARRMAARGAIVRRLPAVETLGSSTVVASDKTGTLTQNRLRLVGIASARGHSEEDVVTAAVLASTADLIGDRGDVRVAGDPIEGGILLAARERGISSIDLRNQREVLRELPFDAERRLMTIVYAEDGGARAFVKGAPEVVLARSVSAPDERSRLATLAERWAAEGQRVLAVAERRLAPGEEPSDDEEVESDLELVGLLALADPLRDTAAESVKRARSAGLGVQIITGDHPATAQAIARQLDLPRDAVRARVTPTEKLRLVERLQRAGEVVAVTGDGVNDAPALRRADVGVAMGRGGTETAREASDLVLTDDDFSTIIAAIREGRTIADNVRKFVAFLLSANFGEVLLFGVAVIAGLGAPMTVAQVLIVNVLTDGLPAVALAQDPPAPGVMQRPPERGDRLFGSVAWGALALVGALVGLAAMGSFLVGRSMDDEAAQTMAYATVAFSELFLAFAVRAPVEPWWKGPLNGYLIAGVAASAVLLALTLFAEPLHEALGTVALDAPEIAIVAGFAVVPFAVVELGKAIMRRRFPLWAEAVLRGPRP